MQTKKWADVEDSCRELLSDMIVCVRKIRLANPDKDPSSFAYKVQDISCSKPVIDKIGRKVSSRRILRMYRRAAKEWQAEFKKQGSTFYIRVRGNNNFV